MRNFLSSFSSRHRLEHLPMIPLRSTIEEVIAVYGPPANVGSVEEFPDATIYEFDVSDYHQVRAWEWDKKVHQFLFISTRAAPGPDLRHVLATYSEGKDWHVLTEGYSHRRDDLDRWVWYSSMPMIGVGTLEYCDAKLAGEERARAEQNGAGNGGSVRASTQPDGPAVPGL